MQNGVNVSPHVTINPMEFPTMLESKRIDDAVQQQQHNKDRIRHADTWIKRSEQENVVDIECSMFLWIAFNAAYGNETALRDFVEEQDKSGVLERIEWEESSGPIRVLLNNHYVFHSFWKAVWRSEHDGDWQRSFRHQKNKVKKDLSRRNIRTVLSVVFHVSILCATKYFTVAQPTQAVLVAIRSVTAARSWGLSYQ